MVYSLVKNRREFRRQHERRPVCVLCRSQKCRLLAPAAAAAAAVAVVAVVAAAVVVVVAALV